MGAELFEAERPADYLARLAASGPGRRHCGILAHSTEGAALCFLEFCQEGVRRLGSHVYPDVTLDYIAFGHSMPGWDAGDHDSIRATLSVSAGRLAAAGADFFVCPDNTAHMALERPGPDLALPGLHIAEVLAGQAARDGRTRVGVLGTRYTMEGPLYPRALAARGIASEIPAEARAALPGDRAGDRSRLAPARCQFRPGAYQEPRAVPLLFRKR